MNGLSRRRTPKLLRQIWIWGLGLSALQAAVSGCGAAPVARDGSKRSADIDTSLLTPPSNPARGLDALAQNKTCESCHTAIASEWRGSLHQLAYVEPAYQRALEREPLPFCRGCHAPEADASATPEPALAELGVGCVTCHVVQDQILAGGQGEPSPSAHAVLRTLSRSPAGACSSCHEFEFPDRALRKQGLLMQSTVSEHKSSSRAGETCASCHMTRAADGHLRHDFAASRSQDQLRRALSVKARRVSAGQVELTLEARGVGHALPTGDLFRRLEVAVELVGADYQVVARDHRYLTRHFRTVKVGSFAQRQLDKDDRLFDGEPRELQLVVDYPEGEALPIAWWVAYQRVGFPRANKEDAEIEQELLLASGTLPPIVSEA
ncbi:MAG: hypothetical protein KC492_05025, partial [Myxococcales bacterium]|nr:hypothetical protein [Myxococcales bacterium]